MNRIWKIATLGVFTFCLGSLPLLGASQALKVTVDAKDGSYTISNSNLPDPVIHAAAAVLVDGHWFHAGDYPSHRVEHTSFDGELGSGEEWTVYYSGRKDAPDLRLRIRDYAGQPFGEVQLTAHNSTGKTVAIERLRLVDAAGSQLLHLGGDPAQNRVLSDSFSEDRPAMQIRDWENAENQVHRAVGSQLIYNRQSHYSWFVGALTSDKFLTILRLHMAGEHQANTRSYEVDSTGTTEMLEENSLMDSPKDDRVILKLPVAPNAELSSERMLFSVSDDYHHQLETYGRMIRDLHHARVSAPTPLGWWSWTAYYFGLNQGTALSNSEWLSQHLKSFGYTYFHMDEGYQYARGEYTTPDAALFPDGIASLEHQVLSQGLVPGVWTAPFEISERSWVFKNHPEWLVHNAQGKPIALGMVTEGKDQLYALDPTHPGAQAYLRRTYSTLVNNWGIRYIKMDFMEDSAVEGYYHVPNTTALEAQRIGIGVIRQAVGNQVLLDKDGCELLNPVGLVDVGRISQDTGHTFSASKDAASGVAARYYMNRNYFIADPDAFTVSAQTVDDQAWHGGQRPLTLDEAKVSIALSAVSGGMFEIGDDLPTLGEDRERVALVENKDLIDMAHLGHASIPFDLMNYEPADLQPSIFLLHESPRQSILTIFNWTESSRIHMFSLSKLGLKAKGNYTITDTLTPEAKVKLTDSELEISQPSHSVRVLKIVDDSLPAAPPALVLSVPSQGKAGEELSFKAKDPGNGEPALQAIWDFGDGVQTEGFAVNHTYTHAGKYVLHVHSAGLAGTAGSDQTFPVAIEGAIVTKFIPEAKRRPQEQGFSLQDPSGK